MSLRTQSMSNIEENVCGCFFSGHDVKVACLYFLVGVEEHNANEGKNFLGRAVAGSGEMRQCLDDSAHVVQFYLSASHKHHLSVRLQHQQHPKIATIFVCVNFTKYKPISEIISLIIMSRFVVILSLKIPPHLKSVSLHYLVKYQLVS